MENWYERAFSKDYIRIYKHRDSSEAQEFIDNLLLHTPLPHNPLCLDLACGFGRHLTHLNEKGIRTYGIDLSHDLLHVASQSKTNKGMLIRGDMRRLPFSSRFDFVFSFFSSFGYFAEDFENLNVLKEISRVLKFNGGFLIDYMNSRYILKNLIPDDCQQFPDFELRQKRWMDPHLNTVEKELTIKDNQGERVIRESLKLYTPDDFSVFCRDAGLTITKKLGSYYGETFNDESRRLILIGEKNEGKI